MIKTVGSHSEFIESSQNKGAHYKSICSDKLVKYMNLSSFEYNSSNCKLFFTADREFLLVIIDSIRMELYKLIVISFGVVETKMFDINAEQIGCIKSELKKSGITAHTVSRKKSKLFASLCAFENSFYTFPRSLTISVLYVKRGQSSKKQWFSNQADVTFLSFLSRLGNREEQSRVTYNRDWRGSVPTLFHVASLLSEDDQRGLIGNNLSVIVFLEEGSAPFSARQCNSLGKVSQNWCVIQPSNYVYRLQFFTRDMSAEGIENFGPGPINTRDVESAVDCMLEKCFVTQAMLRKVGPCCDMYQIPRKAVFDQLVETYT